MTLRTKLLGLFVLLAAGPLLAIGLIGYGLSQRAVASQLEGQTRVLAERAAVEINRRMRLVESDLRLLGENAESERLLRLAAAQVRAASPADAGQATPAPTGPASPADMRQSAAAATAAARQDAERFLEAAWELVGGSYAAAELLDDADTPLLRLGAAPGDPVAAGLLEHSVPIHAADGPGERLGTVRALIRLDALLPGEGPDARFGVRGIAAVVHRPDGRVLHLSGDADRLVRRFTDLGLGDLALATREASGGVRADVSAGAPPADGAGARIGWVALVDAPPLAVISLADRAEFAAPFDRQRTIQLVLILLLAAAVIPTGGFLLRRATRSLDELTAAADRVGQGDFMPDLPRAGGDEVGRLTVAFRTMTHEIRSKVEEIERSRQLAAVGEFAAELSHEIRNPLTAVKLNLQRLERMVARAEVPAEAARPLHLALREIGRLERVVRGALHLGRPTASAAAERRTVNVRELVEGAVEPLREQLDTQGIRLDVACDDAPVHCDPAELTGALLNVLLNAVEAMPAGGTLSVRAVRAADGVDVLITDTGGGIPDRARERLFRPFATTKPDGTGLGLALAHRAVEAHGGALTLEHTGPGGTTFRMRLPVAPERVPA
jgi:signal transduction histidine kinase